MIDQISEYIKNVSILLVFTAFVGIILPSSRYKGYVDVVLGVLVVCMIAKPILSVFAGNDFNVSGELNGLYAEKNFNATGRSNFQTAVAKKSFEGMLFSQIEGILSREGFLLVSLDQTFSLDSGEISSLSLVVSEHVIKLENEKNPPLISIEKPREIKTFQNHYINNTSQDKEAQKVKKMKKLISSFYNLAEDNIYIKIQTTEIPFDVHD